MYIWNPYYGHYRQALPSPGPGQDQALDLTVSKTEDKPEVMVIKKEPFDFNQFYQTYQQIASRTSPSAVTSPPEQRKRRFSSSESSDSDQSFQEAKKSKQEEPVIVVKQEPLSSTHIPLAEPQTEALNTRTRQGQKVTKNMKSRTEQKLASIRESCACRFCYEDHIIKMRLKTSKPWLNL